MISDADSDLYAVRGWRGPAWDGSNRATTVASPVAPIVSARAHVPLTIARPANGGWLRGASPTGQTAQGLLSVPSGSGLIWYWPAVLTVLVDVCVGVIALRFVFVGKREVWRRRRPGIRTSLKANRAPSTVCTHESLGAMRNPEVAE